MLNALVVVDLTRNLPGPYLTQLLAQHGARVVKVEAPAGDTTRLLEGAFQALNRGKQSLALDLKQPAAVDLLRRLVARADVLVEDFRPGVLARLGLALEELRQQHPRLITCSLSGYGQTGPERERAGHDLNFQARAGSLGWPPRLPQLQVADLAGAWAGVSGVLLALYERERSGRGRAVDVGLFEALAGLACLDLGRRQLTPEIPRGGEDLLTGGVPAYQVYRCADDEWLAVAALEPKFWVTFCERIQRPEWANRGLDPELREELGAYLASRSRGEWLTQLEGADCCVDPVREPGSLLRDPQLTARGALTPERLGNPLHFSPPGPPGTSEFAARPGADAERVLGELLGLDADQLAELRRAGVI